jgi:hypothetical protein
MSGHTLALLPRPCRQRNLIGDIAASVLYDVVGLSGLINPELGEYLEDSALARYSSTMVLRNIVLGDLVVCEHCVTESLTWKEGF